MTKKTTTVDMPQLQMRAMFVPDSLNKEDRTVDLVIATDSPVIEWDRDRYETVVRTLEISPESLRTERLDRGIPILWHHNQWEMRSLLGRSTKWWVENGKLFIRARISDAHENSELAWKMVSDGTLAEASCGFKVYRSDEIIGDHEDGRMRVRATDIEVFEGTLTSIGADSMTGTRSSGKDELTTCIITRADSAHDNEMSKVKNQKPASAQPDASPSKTPASPPGSAAVKLDEYRHAAEVNRLCAEQGLEAAFAQGLIERSLNPEEASAQIAAHIAKEAEGKQYRHAAEVNSLCAENDLDAAFAQGLIERSLSPSEARTEIANHLAQGDQGKPMNSHFRMGSSDLEKRSLAIGNALDHRVAPSHVALTEDGKAYRGMSMLEIGRELLELRGVNTRGMAKMDLAERSLHTSSDLPAIIGNSTRRTLLRFYDAGRRSFTRWANRITLPDFRATERVRLGGLGMQKLSEKGEIKSGRLADGRVVIKLESFGEKIGFTRQMMVNDDLDSLSRIPQMWGNAGARNENSLVYALITGNAKTADNKALFHADHKNSGTGALDLPGVSAGRTRMALHPAFQTKEAMNLEPGFILCPAALQTDAQQLVSSTVVPGTTGDVNVFANGMEVISEALLDAHDPTTYYLIVGAGQFDTVEYGYLEGSEGMDLRMKNSFDIDGIELRTTHDFAASLMGHEGIDKTTAS